MTQKETEKEVRRIKREQARKKKELAKLYPQQTVESGIKTYRIGPRHDICKTIDKLRCHTFDTVIFENVLVIPPFAFNSLNGVRHLTIRNVGIIDSWAINRMPDLESITIEGSIGYVSSHCIGNCNCLKKIDIEANIFSSDSYIYFCDCPMLTEIVLQGAIPKTLYHITDNFETYLDNFSQREKSKYPFENYKETYESKDVEHQEYIRLSLLSTSKWVNKVYGINHDLDEAIGSGASEMWGFIRDIFGSWNRAWKLRRINWAYREERDNPSVKTLKLSTHYTVDEKPIKVNFEYASEYRPVFEYYRRRFHLRKEAGKGKDTDKMIRLCRWIHGNIRHKGDAVPNVAKNLSSLMDATARIGMPGNCFIQAICLSEALLSIGIKAKYIKGFRRKDEETEYHVFVAAWSKSLKKRVFLDPTYGAYVRDEEGTLLSPAEVRHGLINDIPMVLNEDADYNGDRNIAKTYLSNYLAPNMFYMAACTISQDSTEGPANHPQGEWIALVPSGEIKRKFLCTTTTDDNLFWQPPI